MSRQVYTIRRAFLVPLGIDALLLLCLWAFSWLPQGSTTERLVFTFFFFPSAYLFLECVFRRVTVDDTGIALRRLWRQKEVSWEGVTRVAGLSLHKKVYLLLTTVRGFFIISNAYERFPELTEEILSRVDPARVEDEARQQAKSPPSGIAHVVMAWIAALFMTGIILIKVLSV